ncbi:MAG: fluoride efflux transporter FluC [Acidimicrobiales bacterium]
MTDDETGPRPGPGGRPPAAEHHYRRLEHLAQAIGADDDLPIDPELGPDDVAGPSPEHRRALGPVRPHRAHPVVLAAIFAGGFLGTLARYSVGRAWPTPVGHFPTDIFVINTSGAFVLGLLLTVLLERLRWRNRLVSPFAVTGVLGGWTTYSSLVVGATTVAHDGHLALAAGYLALSLLCGAAGVALAIALVRSRQLDALATVAPAMWLPSLGTDGDNGDGGGGPAAGRTASGGAGTEVRP